MGSSISSEKSLNGFSSHLRFQLLTISYYVYVLGSLAIVPTSVSCSGFLCFSNTPNLFLLWDRCTYCLAQLPPTTFLHVIPDFYLGWLLLVIQVSVKMWPSWRGFLGAQSKGVTAIPSRHSQPHSSI